jgi:hypothetical protein
LVTTAEGNLLHQLISIVRTPLYQRLLILESRIFFFFFRKFRQENMTEIEKGYDAEQLKFMNEEFCILVNGQDDIVGHDSKKNSIFSIRNEGLNLLSTFNGKYK